MGRPRKIEIDLADIRAMTERGARLKEIAAKYGCSRQTLLNRMNEAGIPAHPPYSNPGHLNPAWKGGRMADGKGYMLIYAPDHPQADSNRRVREHRLVMEQTLGRYLRPEEVVDHIDGDTMNNHPSNLRVFPNNAAHLAATLAGKVPRWSDEGRERLEAAVRKPRKKRQPIRHRSETDGQQSPE